MDKCFRNWIDEGKLSYSAYLYLTGESVDSNSSPAFDNRLKISVLITTYKRSSYLIRLLNSIKNQQYNNCEIIIVDDASNDDTEACVKQYIKSNQNLNILYLANEHNVGVCESKKRAYLKASGDIIIFTDDDDYYIEPAYFSMLSQLYEKHPDCIMTIASTIQHNERNGKYEYLDLNTPGIISSREYLNHFTEKYKKPRSMFTMSLKSAVLKKIHFKELLCFHDNSLYMFGLLGEGNVYTINQAVGIYQIHTGNLTGNSTPELILKNLESKEDIYHRAKEAGLLDSPKEWHYRHLSNTASWHLVNIRKINKQDIVVFEWMSGHLERTEYYRFVVRIMKSRIKRWLKVNFEK